MSATLRRHSGGLMDADPLFFKNVLALACQQNCWESWKQLEDLASGELHDEVVQLKLLTRN